MKSSLRSRRQLRLICVGTGRDGTQSLNSMIQNVYARKGARQSYHEFRSREFYQYFCEYRETKDPCHLAALAAMVAECPYDSIVGNGYAAILPLFAEKYGRDLTLIHLRRRDRRACIASLKKNCEMFPAAYGYYSSSPQTLIKRMTAFHFGEMSRADWEKLSIDEKFGWYYNKTHALIHQHHELFNQYVEIFTEDLDSTEARRQIAELAAGVGIEPPPRTHLNASVIEIASFAEEHRHRINWLLGRLNLEEVAGDDVYALQYFVEKFVAWIGYQIDDAPSLAPAIPPPAPQIAANLDRALATLRKTVRELEWLQEQFSLRCQNSDICQSADRAAERGSADLLRQPGLRPDSVATSTTAAEFATESGAAVKEPTPATD